MEEVYIRRNRFSERLKAKRAEAGLGQIAFAKLLGISQPTLAKYEMCKREPDLDGLMDICEKLSTTPNQMLGFDDTPPIPSITTGNNSAIAIGSNITQTITPPSKTKAPSPKTAPNAPTGRSSKSSRR